MPQITQIQHRKKNKSASQRKLKKKNLPEEILEFRKIKAFSNREMIRKKGLAPRPIAR